MPDFEHVHATYRPSAEVKESARSRKAVPTRAAQLDVLDRNGPGTDAGLAAAAARELAQAHQHIAQLEQQVAQLRGAVANEIQFAYFDELTGLPNRRLLLDRFNQALARGLRQHTQMALLFLDLDGFKGINDTLGHGPGDELLRQVAARLNAGIRATDTACRYGGDEFVVLLAQVESHDRALVVARKIRAALAKPYLLKQHVVHLTTSLGLAVYPTDGAGYADLIERSDLAMYFDKARCPAAACYARAPGRPHP